MSKQTYKYQGEEFVITKPDGCAMKSHQGAVYGRDLDTRGN